MSNLIDCLVLHSFLILVSKTRNQRHTYLHQPKSTCYTSSQLVCVSCFVRSMHMLDFRTNRSRKINSKRKTKQTWKQKKVAVNVWNKLFCWIHFFVYFQSSILKCLALFHCVIQKQPPPCLTNFSIGWQHTF